MGRGEVWGGHFAKLSHAPAPAGLSLALFPNYPDTRPIRPAGLQKDRYRGTGGTKEV